MLIHSPRIARADQEHWNRLEHYDQLLAQELPLTEMAETARKAITEFAAAGPCYASTSWGKDSTVLAHLIATSGLTIPLVWVRVKDYENPDCPTVRDAFLAQFPHVDYHEIEVEATAKRWWEDGADFAPASQRTSRGGFARAEKMFGDRHISGVRAEESRIRGVAMRRWGTNGPKASRPIGWWQATDIFAYLHKHDLPVHPAYAQSYGGKLDRRWLRVSSLGGIRGADKGRAEWEAHYYPDIIHQAGKGH